ncbi:cysteine-rich repeat protein [Corallococcus coralloides DSM 2259]|uniref:Cysteine-rich repeat protein n=1 Tax=Corallococcus coralloides (strain ATCC 25202 / DSM 2259 / NBRC 100086 / M2) TaxID=1144275 RepID=H8N0N3_CORCM|nr:DUF4215 domain-containing protein [Corallococcus coralloides]AFE06431.1 cysteine-rich repeat protein [Corallococcus coralloides DSM 2259]
MTPQSSHRQLASRAWMVLAFLLPLLTVCSDPPDRTCPSGLLCPEGRQCAAKQDICIPSDCGDGAVEDGEACDDGNVIDGDGCNRTCTSLEVCGNGVVDIAKGEKCDDGNTLGGDACSADCRSSEVCGNGVRDTAVGEVCDDGNNVSGDGCSADCLSQETCGNGYTDAAKEERCDDGNTEDGDGCSADCHVAEVCGDGARQGREQCDTQGESGTCNANCTLPACGDGIVNAAAGEQCEHNNTSSRSCPYGQATCTVCREDCMAFVAAQGNVCGDGARDAAYEACDDSNTTTETSCPYGQASCQRCSRDCQSALALRGNVCGDGIQDPSAANEACDDGNTTTETACPYGVASCVICRSDCKETLSVTGNTCGDGVRDPVNEACDDGNVSTETTCPYGTESCQRCSSDCKTALSLQGNVCGDGVWAPSNEACDDGNTLTCGSCSADCKVKTLQAATGTITASASTNMNDGETFTISDGINTPVTFEVDRNGSLQNPAHQRVQVENNTPATQVALIIRDAINAVAEPFEIEASVVIGTFVVNVTHNLKGSIGNQTMTEKITNTAFKVSGMNGGSGYDCAQGTKCVGNEDCAYDLICDGARVCSPP